MSKQLQIDYEIFLDLCKYHLAGDDSPELLEKIRQGLQDKMQRAAARETYTKEKRYER